MLGIYLNFDLYNSFRDNDLTDLTIEIYDVSNIIGDINWSIFVQLKLLIMSYE